MANVQFRDVVKKYASTDEALGVPGGEVGGIPVPSAEDFATAEQGAKADTAVQPDDLGAAATMSPVEVVTDPDAQAALSGAFGRYANPVAAGMRWRPEMTSPGTATMSLDRVALCGVFSADQDCTIASAVLEVTGAGDGAAVIRIGTALMDGPTVSGQTLTEHGSVDGTSEAIHTLPVGRAVAAGSRIAVLALSNGADTTAPTVRAGIPTLHNVDAASDPNVTRYRTLLSSAIHTGAMPSTVPSLHVGGTIGVLTVGLLIGA